MIYKYRAKIIKVIDGETIDVDIGVGFFIVLNDQ